MLLLKYIYVINEVLFKTFSKLDLGHADLTQLYQQLSRHTQFVYNTSFTMVLSCLKREATSQNTIPFDQCNVPYLEAIEFLGVSQI